jgi:hypothetical protein
MPDSTDGPTKTYEIVMTSGKRQRITIPATWKVSFGAIVPASAKSTAQGYSGSTGWGLRVWESTDKQRAVYSGVVEFWDVSIPVQVRAVRYYGKEEWLIDDGTYINGKAALVEKQWVDEGRITTTPEETEDIVPYDLPVARTKF